MIDDLITLIIGSICLLWRESIVAKIILFPLIVILAANKNISEWIYIRNIRAQFQFHL